MIDEKKIEEAAINASIEDTDKGRVREDYVIGAMADHELGFQDGFKAGIDWFLDNLWHDANEEPEKDKVLLIKYHQLGVRDPRYLVLNEGANGDWSDTVADYHIYSWLYIEDLMKGGK